MIIHSGTNIEWHLLLISVVSSYNSGYQNKNLKNILIIKLNKQNAISLTKKGVIYINTYTYKCTRVLRTKQCTRCLKYGHVKNECNELAKCSHCAGDHPKSECTNTDQRAGMRADFTKHSPYCNGCQVRKLYIQNNN